MLVKITMVREKHVARIGLREAESDGKWKLNMKKY